MIVKENLSVSEGHYHSKCKRTNIEGELTWFLFNDQDVQELEIVLEPKIAEERGQTVMIFKAT
jgi:hypothetical protein